MGIRSFLLKRKKSDSPSNPPHFQNPLQLLSLSQTSNTQISELKNVFEKFDANGDEKISHSELGSIMESLGHPATEEELNKMIQEVDSDGDGFIDLDEFIVLNTHEVDSDKILDDLRDAFSVFDVDRSGAISPEELKRVLENLGDGYSLEECRRMISGVDVDGDGLIDFEEFKIMMMGGNGDHSGADSG